MAKLSAKASSAAAGASKGQQFGPGQREFQASLRARERAELASQRSIARQSLRERQAAFKQEMRSRAQAVVSSARAEAKARADGAREGARLGNIAGRRRAANEIHVQQEAKEFRRSLIGGAGGRALGTVGAVGRAGVTAAGVTGAALAASSVSHALRLDESTRRLAIAGRMPGQTGANPEDLRRQFTNLGVETGIRPEAIAGGAAKFVAKTGDLTTALANMRNFAITAQATGAEIEHVASAGADLAEKFNIKKVEDMSAALAILTFQGKKGAFELKDMAEQFPEMAAAASRAGMTGVSGMRTLGGLAQIARQSTGSGSEASTALQMMLTQLVTKADKLKSGKALGGEKVDVFEGGDPTKKARDIPTILSEIISKSEGNQTELAKVFDIRGTRAISPLIKTYRDAAEGTIGTKEMKQEAGKQAVLGFIEDRSAGGGSWDEVQTDAAAAMKATSVQLDILRTKLEAAVASTLFPALVRLIPEFERLVPVVSELAQLFVSMVSAFAQNPITGIGAIITASVVKDLAAAGLGEAARMAMIQGMGPLMAGGALALAIGSLTLGYMAVETMQVQAQQNVDKAVASGDEVRARALAELKDKGELSEGTRADLEKLNTTEVSRRAQGQALVESDSGFGAVGGYLSALGNSALDMLPGVERSGTLDERNTLKKAAGDSNYTSANIETQRLLELDNLAGSFKTGSEEVRKILVDGATQSAEILKTGAAASPNRSDVPKDKTLKAK